MLKAIIFDLDGVLIDSKDYHYEALNQALGKKYAISREDHVSIYDGLPTRAKLELLTKNKGFPVELYDQIWQEKQEATPRSREKDLKIFDQIVVNDDGVQNIQAIDVDGICLPNQSRALPFK